MKTADAADWKTPLGYYEKAIEELGRTKAELQEELANIKVSIKKDLESKIDNYQVEIHKLKSELQMTKEQFATADKTANDAKQTANDAQVKLQKMQENMTNELNSEKINITELSQIKEQLSQVLYVLEKPNFTNFDSDSQKQILTSLSSLQLQISQLEIELTLVSPASGINYIKLRDLLAAKAWQEADKETWNYMLQISEREGESWLDDGDIKRFPRHDLRIINNLWTKYSEGKFGFGVQKQIWQYPKEDYKRFGDRVGWLVNISNSEWRKYEEAIFSLDAPEGHLPYTVRVLGLGYRNPGELSHRLKLFLLRY
ncbi:MAG: GUN4 domain-containing protein [Goleter apudmare HA4340-LM2]|nr:GUN4 domain-containing protein [Goleter apudmare HA4340-LM2]